MPRGTWQPRVGEGMGRTGGDAASTRSYHASGRARLFLAIGEVHFGTLVS